MSESSELTLRLKQASILVVDDEPLNLILMEEVLEDEGFSNAIYMDSPVQALEYYKKEQVDLILLDLKMPVMDGYEFMGKLQALDKPIPPILVLTASADKDTYNKVIEAKAQGIISKPFNFEDVLADMERLLLAN